MNSPVERRHVAGVDLSGDAKMVWWYQCAWYRVKEARPVRLEKVNTLLSADAKMLCGSIICLRS